jgi:hypothetical protein
MKQRRGSTACDWNIFFGRIDVGFQSRSVGGVRGRKCRFFVLKVAPNKLA